MPLAPVFCPSPSFLGMAGTCQTQDLQPKLNNPTEGTADGSLARQKQSSEPCAPAADPILPSLPAATDSLGHQDSPLRCLAVTAAKPTLNTGGSCLRVRVSGRCTGYSALPYGVRLPSRAINTTAGRRQQQKALKPSLLCLGKSSLGWGCQSLQRRGSGQE